MDVLLSFAAALLALRLAAELVRRYHAVRVVAFAWWAASLLAFSVASAALCWSAAVGWDDRSFRVYYLCGGLLTAALLGAGSLVRYGWRWVGSLALVYVGLAVGVVVAEPLEMAAAGSALPDPATLYAFVPARLLAIVGNVVGTVAAVGVALVTFSRRPRGNALVIAGVVAAAAGSAFAGSSTAGAAVAFAAASALLYGGFVVNR